MKNQLHLHIPESSKLWYRKQMLSDAATMDYNKGYNLIFQGYHNDTGCIDFPEEQWKKWYNWFVCGKPERFYAYIVRNCDNAFIGEVNVHKSSDEEWYCMGIVLESTYRGRGYAIEALHLLLTETFENLSALGIHNDFEKSRTSAIKAHLSASFVVNNEENGIVHLCITREQYFARFASSEYATKLSK